MDAAKIHAKIYAGRGKAAKRLGFVYNVMRPILAGNPMTNQVAAINAAFNAGDSKYLKPNMPGDAYWYADMDGRETQPGDYLVFGDSIYYVAAQQHILPIICVECNRSVRLTRAKTPTPSSSSGNVEVLPYSGSCDSTDEMDDVIGTSPGNNGGAAIGWPASILFGKNKMRNALALPAGTPEQIGWTILLPVSVPTVVQVNDRFVDDLGRVYVTNAAELSDTGWRIQVIEVHV